jgi:serine/threonine protein kinase
MAAVLANPAAETIGRFRIERELGRGAQGTVYLAEDPHLQRQVAVKTLRLDRYSGQRADLVRLMLDEARIVGKLQHPNIVTLFDAGEADGLPYLVFEYVDGEPLSQVIASAGKIAPADAAGLALAMLRGIAYAHERRIVHRDIKPANIMVTSGWVPRIMDFGIASRTDLGTTSGKGLFGTPRYMAPEYLKGAEYTEACDVFAAGMVLYEMVTGSSAVKGSDPHALMYAMVHQAFERPSQRNPAVDERLERIVMRALEKDPAQRFPNAAAMIDALAEYARPKTAAQEGDVADAQGSALDYVLRRMRFKSDFPALSTTIAQVNSVVSSENEPTSALADSVLKDVALTNKILRMVNTVMYSSYGGSVSTISRAVSILGFQKVRGAALSLMLFEHLQNKTQAADMKDLVTSSYFSGMLSRDLAGSLDLRNPEEGFICAMFHRLGKLLATFYLHEEASDVARLARAEGIDEDDAALEVLGISYTDLGIGIAKKWNLPEQIIGTIAPLRESSVPAARSDAHKLRAVADMSNRLCDVVKLPEGSERDAALRKLSAKYENVFRLDASALSGLVEKSARAFIEEARTLDLQVGNGALMQKLKAMGAGAEPPGSAAAKPDTGAPLAETMLNTVLPAAVTSGKAIDPDGRSSMLTAGISDITNTLAGDYVLNDALRIILETMYRGMGFKRVMLCTLDQASRSLKARFGFGEDTERIVKKGFHIPLDPAKDVFSVALSKAADLCIEDRDSAKVKSHVPEWYRTAVQATGFILFPVIINKKPLALIYADSDDARTLRFEKNELSLLKTLRNQAILAIRQKSPG